MDRGGVGKLHFKIAAHGFGTSPAAPEGKWLRGEPKIEVERSTASAMSTEIHCG